MRAWKSSIDVEHDGAAAVHHQRRRRRARLDDRAARREVAAQHGDAGLGLERRVERLDDVGVEVLRVGDVLADRLAVGGDRVEVEQVRAISFITTGRPPA